MKNNYKQIEKFLSSNSFISKNIVKDIEYYEKDGYRYSKILFFNERVSIDNEDFEYQINSKGFRGKDFNEFNSNNINILFAGCSQTLGVGLPEKNTWYSKLSNKIHLLHKEKDVDFYNLGVNGGGIELAIKNVMAFIKSGNVPNYLFLFLPESSRSVAFSKDTGKFECYLISNDNNEQKEYYKNYIHENKLFTNFILLSMLEEICKAHGIELLWTSWDVDENNMYSQSSFNNFFIMDKDLKYHMVKEPVGDNFPNNNYLTKKEHELQISYFNKLYKNKDNEPYWHCARDGLHYGSAASNFIAEKFMLELIRKR